MKGLNYLFGENLNIIEMDIPMLRLILSRNILKLQDRVMEQDINLLVNIKRMGEYYD